jgi:hypothetical protein
MFGAPKNDIDFEKIFSRKNILVKSPYYEKGKKEKKKEIPRFFSQPLNPTQEITPLKNKSLPLPIPINKTPLFFKFIKTPHLKTNSLRNVNI